MLLLALALACDSPAPVPLPAPVAPPPALDTRMVRAPGVHGFLGRPLAGATEAEAVLLLVEAQGEPARARVRALAEAGSVALAIAPEVEPGAARAYLAGIPGVRGVLTRCERAVCPEESP